MTKKETTKKTRKNVKKITIDDMACKGNFIPITKCFKCHFAQVCHKITQENAIKKAVKNSGKKSTTKRKKHNNNTIAFLSLFVGDF